MRNMEWAQTMTPVCMEPVQGMPPSGLDALMNLLNQASSYVACLRENPNLGHTALLGRVRGTGPGVSFGALVEAIKTDFPVRIASPFEGSTQVAGGVLLPSQAGLQNREDGFLFLRFEAGARDLPMHTHECSERLIYVLEGRGFFHISSQNVQAFDGKIMRHVPIRSRDVLLFKRGTVHTFSTEREPLWLLSYHGPFIPLEDPNQYTLPRIRVLPADRVARSDSRIACDPAWSRLI